MSASNATNPHALVEEIERLNTQLDDIIGILARREEGTDHTALLEAAGTILHERGMVLDKFLQWCSSPQGKRAFAGGRRAWQDVLAQLHSGDEHRAQRLGTLIAGAAERLRQRTAHQALFIYQRGSL
ncbi:MAG: hypothetical protein RML15_05430 [Bacteroidota bacterium]|nr:hypothetical protein [Candidatus Kapabacteria bacterium]MCX7937141.1 hypothetical protein [Chlorobiota bacterium]MDW8271831.1 hypothetical protein [Bacteroidota bacterium]